MNHHHNNTVDEAPQNLRKLNDFVSRYMGKMKPPRDELPPPPAATAMEPSSTAAAPAVTSSIPKRPLSAYNIFFQNERDRILLHSRRSSLGGGQRERPHTLQGKMGFAELARTIGRTWRKLDGSERQYYQDLAAKEKRRYERELAEYHLRSGRSSAASASASAVANKSSSSLLLSSSSLKHTRDDTKAWLSLSDAAAVSSSPSSSHQNAAQEDTSKFRAAASAAGAAATTASVLETSPLGFGFVAKTAGDDNTTTTRAATALMNSALATRATNVDLQGKAVSLSVTENNAGNNNNGSAFWSQYMAQSLEQLSEHYSSMPSIHNFKRAEGSSSGGGVGGKGGAPGDALLARPASCPTPIMAPAAPPTGDSALLLPSSASSAGGAVPLNEAADFFASSSWRARPTATTNAEQQQEEGEEVIVRGDDYYDPLSILPTEQQGACSPRSEETQQQRSQQQQQPFSSGTPGEGLFPYGAPPPPTIVLDSDMRDILTQLLESGK